MNNRISASVFLFALAGSVALPAHGQDAPAANVCIAAPGWHRLDGDAPRAAAGKEVLAEMARRDIVLLGERHEDASHHQWQLQTLAALLQLRPRMVIGFESFPRRVQPVLDRWIAGELTARQFL